jgi:DNA-binding transcriptional LysR family regulator
MHEQYFDITMRRLNLDQLHAVVEVARHGSFSAAARQLNLTQPAVSLQVRELEERLGLKLIERLGKRAYPTAAGSELIERAKRIESEVDEALQAMRRRREGWLGRVRIGTGLAILNHLLTPVLRDLRKAHPRIEIVITTGTTEQMVGRLVRNDIDIGLVTLPVNDKSLLVRPVREDPMVAVLPPGDDRVAPAVMTPAGLARYPLILDPIGAQMHALARQWFRDAGIEPRPAMEIDGVIAIRNLVSAGLGASILPVEALLGDSADMPVALRQLSPPLVRSLAVVRRRDKGADPLLSEVERAMLAISRFDVRLPGSPMRMTKARGPHARRPKR